MGIFDSIKNAFSKSAPAADITAAPSPQPAPRQTAQGSSSGPVAATESAGGIRTCTVVSGDTLWRIAERMYGDGSHYMKIFEYQFPRVLRYADIIDAGNQLVVLVMGMCAGVLPRPLGIEPESQPQRLVAVVQEGAGASLGVAKHQGDFWYPLGSQVKVLEPATKEVGAEAEILRSQVAKGRQDTAVNGLRIRQMTAMNGRAGPEP